MEVWQEIIAHEENGARRLVSEYGDRLFASAVLLCRNRHDAEELVFRTLDQAIRKIRKYQDTGDFFNWLYTILLNFRRMDLRRRRVEVVCVGGPLDLPERPDAFITSLVVESGLEALYTALNNIAEPLRAVIIAHYFKGCAIDEIAHTLGVPEGTVKSRLHKAREILHELISRKTTSLTR